ncbi:MAG TPA: sulfotransferase [Fimbriiglobus sp.]|jgi:hypothetical protein
MAFKPPAKPREWSPRMWQGCDFFAWLRLLGRNRFAIPLPYWYIAAVATPVSFVHTMLRWHEYVVYRKRIVATPVPIAPLFVLGHWRTGTTLLHELLILDDRHTFPDTFHCMVPNHPLVTEAFFKRWLRFLMPQKRPMDNMATGWDRPQECEFALCLLGQPSPYADIAFPNHPPTYPGSLDLSGLTPRELTEWKKAYYRFVQAITMTDPRRLVLKSPPHTARIPALLDLFPDARFVHIVRDPYVVYSSTVNLWIALAKKHGLQTLRDRSAIEEKVLRNFRVMHERYEEGKKLIPPGRLVEVRYEEIVKDLVGGTEAIYHGIGLDGFEAVRSKVEAYVAKTRNYETNKYAITDELKAKIRDRWGDIITMQGYD